MLALMQRNIGLNLLEGRVQASVLDWGSSNPQQHLVPDSSAGTSYPDIILAADCVYFEPAFPLLQATLRDLIGPDTTCYFCFKKRRRADMQFFAALKKQFSVKEVEDDPDRDTYSRQNIRLLTVRRKI